MIGRNFDVTDNSLKNFRSSNYPWYENLYENLDISIRVPFGWLMHNLQFTSRLGELGKNQLFFQVYYPAKLEKELERLPESGMNIVLDILFLKNFFHVPAYRFLSDRDRYVLSPWTMVNHLMGTHTSLFNISWKGIREQD